MRDAPMSQDELFINGELLRLRREARGWVLADMATRACMSVKQIRQLEEGGMSAFYSVAVKATAAKKVGVLLGLSAEEVFAQNAAPVVADALSEVQVSMIEVVPEPVKAPEEPDTSVENAHTEPSSKEVEFKSESVEPVHLESSDTSESKEDTPKSKGALWLIAVLLGVALAAGAYFQPQEEEATEPAPPIQVLPPADPVDPASAADAAASTTDVVAAPVGVTASSPAPVASAVSVVRSVVPAASAANPIRSASTPAAAVAPAASAASKAP